MIGWQIRLDYCNHPDGQWRDSWFGSFNSVEEAEECAEKHKGNMPAEMFYRVHVFIRVEWVTPKSRADDDFEGGDSIVGPPKLEGAARTWGRKRNKKFTCRKVEGGKVRIWRIA